MALIFIPNLTCTHLYFFDIFHLVHFQPTLLLMARIDAGKMSSSAKLSNLCCKKKMVKPCRQMPGESASTLESWLAKCRSWSCSYSHVVPSVVCSLLLSSRNLGPPPPGLQGKTVESRRSAQAHFRRHPNGCSADWNVALSCGQRS